MDEIGSYYEWLMVSDISGIASFWLGGMVAVFGFALVISTVSWAFWYMVRTFRDITKTK